MLNFRHRDFFSVMLRNGTLVLSFSLGGPRGGQTNSLTLSLCCVTEGTSKLDSFKPYNILSTFYELVYLRLYSCSTYLYYTYLKPIEAISSVANLGKTIMSVQHCKHFTIVSYNSRVRTMCCFTVTTTV